MGDANGIVTVSFDTIMNKGSITVSGLELIMQEAQGLEFANAADTITVGSASQFTVTFIPDNATNQALSWTSSDQNILRVDTKGMVTAAAEGKAIITATAADGGFTVSKEVVAKKVSAESITLEPADTTIFAGGSFKLKATILPANTTYNSLVWSSSNDSLASVDANGIVTAKAKGTVTITAKVVDGGLTAVSTVNVKNVPITSFTLTAPFDKVGVGSTLQLVGTVTPSNATPKLFIWSSSDTSVATVDAQGLVSALKPGNVTISATTQDEVVMTRIITLTVVPLDSCGLLINSGFESDLIHWNKAEGLASNISLTTTTVSGGYKAATLGSDAAVTTLMSDTIQVIEGTNLEFKANVKLDRVNNQVPSWVGTIITYYNAVGNTISQRKFPVTVLENVYTNYVQQSIVLAAPTGTTKMTVAFSKTGTG